MAYLVEVKDEPTWTTFEGVEKSISEIDHQHLSNIYYFMKYVNPSFYDKEVNMLIGMEIDGRFDGKLLPWRPLKRFRGEIEFLRCKRWILRHGNKSLIVINGKIIGEVV